MTITVTIAVSILYCYFVLKYKNNTYLCCLCWGLIPYIYLIKYLFIQFTDRIDLFIHLSLGVFLYHKRVVLQSFISIDIYLYLIVFLQNRSTYMYSTAFWEINISMAITLQQQFRTY